MSTAFSETKQPAPSNEATPASPSTPEPVASSTEMGAYVTPQPDSSYRSQRATSPTAMALESKVIKSVGENVTGVDHTFNQVKSYKPIDVYAADVPASRSRFGLEDEDELLWDYAIVFEVPLDEEDEVLLPGQTRRWSHPAVAAMRGLKRRASSFSMASSESVKAQTKRNDRPKSRSSLAAAQGHLQHVLHLIKDENEDRFTCEDLIMLYQEMSGSQSIDDEDDGEVDDISGSPNDSGSKPQRRDTIQRLAKEDEAWIKARANQKSSLQAPAVKHFPGRKFFEDIFNDVAEGADHVGHRRFAIAKAFVIVGILAEQCGLETYCRWSSGGDRIVCRVRAEPKELRVMADKQDYSLPMAPYLDHKCPIPAHLEYDQDEEKDWLWARHGVKLANGEKAWSRFRRVDRLKLIDAHIDDFLVIRRLERLGIVQSFFPCDDLEEKGKREIHHNKPLDVEHIREYYGERVALYFTFLGHFQSSVYGIAVVGVVVQIWQILERFAPALTPENTGIPMDLGSLLYSAVIAVWGTLFLERWKRLEARKVTEWGMNDFEAREEPRPEFIGQMRESATIGTLARRGRGETAEDVEAKEMADAWRRARNLPIKKVEVQHPVAWYGMPVMWADETTLKRRIMVAALVTFSFVILAVTMTVAVFIMRAALRYTQGGVILSAAVGGAVNAGFIMLLQNIYSGFTVRITDWENWETQTQWVDSRAMKTFVFNSVNSFGSFVYIAYIRKEYDSGCMGACEHVTFGSAIQTDKCPKASALLDANGGVWPSNVTFTADYREYKGDCVMELWIQLALIFMSRLVIGNLLEIGIPLCRSMKRKAELDRERQELIEATHKYMAREGKGTMEEHDGDRAPAENADTAETAKMVGLDMTLKTTTTTPQRTAFKTDSFHNTLFFFAPHFPSILTADTNTLQTPLGGFGGKKSVQYVRRLCRTGCAAWLFIALCRMFPTGTLFRRPLQCCRSQGGPLQIDRDVPAPNTPGRARYWHVAVFYHDYYVHRSGHQRRSLCVHDGYHVCVSF
jgi:hypothetical protein